MFVTVCLCACRSFLFGVCASLDPRQVSLAPGSRAHTSEAGGALALLVAWGAGATPPPPGYPVRHRVKMTWHIRIRIAS